MNERKMLSIPDAIVAFAALGADERACFLTVLAHELTIRARDTYDVGGDGLDNPERMRSYNEVQHRLLGFLAALLKGDPKRYPDDVLIRIILEHPRDAVLQQQMAEAFARALSLSTAVA